MGAGRAAGRKGVYLLGGGRGRISPFVRGGDKGANMYNLMAPGRRKVTARA